MTVKEYLENRPSTEYNKHIRILSATTKKSLGAWTEFANCQVVSVKVTTKIIFIFV